MSPSYKLIWTTIRCCIVLLFITLSSSDLASQITSSIEMDSINSNSTREEIQRYFGFENTLFRYTTQPYDLTMNVNETANFLDIGPLYFMILPLLLVFVVIKKRRNQIIASIGLILYLISCLYFSKIVTSSTQFITTDQILNKGLVQDDFSTSAKILVPIYRTAAIIFKPAFENADRNFHLEILTYPTVFISFLILLFLTSKIVHPSLRKLSVIYLGFSLLFFLLSGGILWYGYLLIPVSLIVIASTTDKLKSLWLNQVFSRGSIILIAMCLTCFIVLRISNIQPNNSPQDQGTHLFYSNVLAYSSGQTTADESLDLVYPGISSTMKQINSNEDLIYKVGTSLTIHINKNNERVFTDNQLSMFFNLLQTYGSPQALFEALKAYGFGYLIVDLHTASIDRTPDKSLTKKYQLLLESLYNNPRLTILNTDRKVQVSSGNEVRTINAMFGQIEYFGNYAVYRLE